MMKFSNLTKLSILVLVLIVNIENIFAASEAELESDNSRLDCSEKKYFSFGYVFVEPTELAYLNNRPIDLLADTRSEFRAQKFSESARDIYAASQLMKVQAIGSVKGSHLNEAAKNLESVSVRVAKSGI